MPQPAGREPAPEILLIGASRGLGAAMSAEFLKRGWNVTGTVRRNARTELHDLAEANAGRVQIEQLDVTEQEQISALRDRLCGRCFEILFVNAGTANTNQQETIADVSTEQFMRVMLTNALAPMRVIEALQDLVPAHGLIGVMSSGQGSDSPPSRPTRTGRALAPGIDHIGNTSRKTFAIRSLPTLG